MQGVVHAGHLPPYKPAFNTVHYTNADGDTVYRFDGYDIIVWRLHGGYVLHHQGAIGAALARRYNRYTPARVSRNAGQWCILARDGRLVPIWDGMVLDAEGFPVDPHPPRKFRS